MGRLAQTLGVTNKRLFTTTTAEAKAQTLAGAFPSGRTDNFNFIVV